MEYIKLCTQIPDFKYREIVLEFPKRWFVMAPPTVCEVSWFYEFIEAVAKDEPYPTGLVLRTGEETRSTVPGRTYFKHCQGGQVLV